MLDSLIVIGLATLSLGTIQEADGTQVRTFTLKNVGSTALTLKQGYTSCGCTAMDYAHGDTLQVGDTTVVTLKFNPQGKGGDFYESGTLTYGSIDQGALVTRRKHVQMALEGYCVTSKETLRKQYPILLQDGLRLSNNQFDLGYVHHGMERTVYVSVLHPDENNRRENIAVTFKTPSELKSGKHHLTQQVTTHSNKGDITFDIHFDVLMR